MPEGPGFDRPDPPCPYPLIAGSRPDPGVPGMGSRPCPADHNGFVLAHRLLDSKLAGLTNY